MPIFNYVAKDTKGEYHKGEVETADEHEAARLLQRKKLIIISIKAAQTSQSHLLDKLTNRVAFTDVVVFTRQLATMIEAGLVLSEAITVLADQQESKYFKKVLTAIATDIQGGLSFAAALDKHQSVFPPIFINLVKAGEASGKMDTILLQLATSLEKERIFKSKVRGAMIYPIIVVTLMLGVMGVMVFFVMPKLTGLYTQSNIELPLPTKIMLAITNFLLSFWWLMIFVAIGISMAFRRWVSTVSGRLYFDTFLLKAPILGRVVTLVILTTMTRTLTLLIAAGIPILETIHIVSEVVGNVVYKTALENSYKGVERGLTFSNEILAVPVIPKLVGQMIRTGEETGKLDEVMAKLAEYYEGESDEALKNITTLIEPIILIVLGLGVAFLVISIILPIYKLTTSIQ